ncbi:MAG: SPASM domain-containing protein [Calditrichales bacterium]|nr:MAG: SPASM domain-containing protein [Calditrichales bacterium]
MNRQQNDSIAHPVISVDYHKFCYENHHYLYQATDMKAYRIDADLYKQLERMEKHGFTDANKIPALKRVLKTMNLMPAEQQTGNKAGEHLRRLKISNISLNVAQQCNMACIYCYGAGGTYGESGMMDRQTAFQAVDFLFRNSGEAKAVSIVFFGGEPLLNFDLIKAVVDYAKQQGNAHKKGVYFALTTNGTCLSPPVINYLNRNKFSVTISLDGDAKEQNTNRPLKDGKDSFKLVIKRINQFLESRDGKATARATLMTGEPSAGKIREKLKSYGFQKVEIVPATGQKTNQEPSYQSVFNDQEVRADELLHDIKSRRRVPDDQLIKTLRRLAFRCAKMNFCGAGSNTVAISSSGKSYPCHRFVGMSEFSFDFVSRFRHATQMAFVSKISAKSPACQNCWALKLCGGGCYYDNYREAGDPIIPSARNCEITKRQIEMAIYVYDQLVTEDLYYLKGFDLYN